MTLSAAIALLESLVARHEPHRHRYAIELIAHVAVKNGDSLDAHPWTDDRDAAIYRQGYEDARARLTTEGP